MQQPIDADLVSAICLPFLKGAQNGDGGWGFHPGYQSRVEPTSWALLALQRLESSNETQQAGFRFLRSAQLPDGAWPAAPNQNVGCWTTSLASWALLADPQSRSAVAAGLRWICEDWPRTAGFILNAIRKIAPRRQVTSQNDSLRGWGWTPNTASWIEPTTFGLIALRKAPRELLPARASKRCQLAKALVYDRMCPGGGWNCGNPMVYGVPGDPLVEPTVWALLALYDEPNRPEKLMSLEWLEKNASRILGPGSMALARICLGTYGREWPSDAPNLSNLYQRNQFLGNVPVMAWTSLALETRTDWFTATRGEDH